jgi:nucleoside-diphosphate-sugar epimerase
VILVTGAAGFLGSHVTQALRARGTPVRALVHPGDHVTNGADGVHVVRADVTDRAAVQAAVEGVECVLHCAARTGVWGSHAEYERVNVTALRTLVEVAMAAGVRRLVHVSSIAVHGTDVGGTADERAPLRGARNPYSRTKLAGEHLLEGMIRQDGAPVTIVRPGWIYGPQDGASFGRLARTIATGRMSIIGSGENHLPLIYVGDVVRGILLAGAADVAVGRSYLLVNDEPVTQRQFVERIAAELGVAPPTRRIPYRLGVGLATVAELASRAMPGTPPRATRYGVRLLAGENRFLIERAQRELGFTPQVRVAEGVRRSVRWYRAALGAPSESMRRR